MLCQSCSTRFQLCTSLGITEERNFGSTMEAILWTILHAVHPGSLHINTERKYQLTIILRLGHLSYLQFNLPSSQYDFNDFLDFLRTAFRPSYLRFSPHTKDHRWSTRWHLWHELHQVRSS